MSNKSVSLYNNETINVINNNKDFEEKKVDINNKFNDKEIDNEEVDDKKVDNNEVNINKIDKNKNDNIID